MSLTVEYLSFLIKQQNHWSVSLRGEASKSVCVFSSLTSEVFGEFLSVLMKCVEMEKKTTHIIYVFSVFDS